MKLIFETVHGSIVHEEEIEGASLKGDDKYGKLPNKEPSRPDPKNREG